MKNVNWSGWILFSIIALRLFVTDYSQQCIFGNATKVYCDIKLKGLERVNKQRTHDGLFAIPSIEEFIKLPDGDREMFATEAAPLFDKHLTRKQLISRIEELRAKASPEQLVEIDEILRKDSLKNQ